MGCRPSTTEQQHVSAALCVGSGAAVILEAERKFEPDRKFLHLRKGRFVDDT